jgi:ferredoxin--NADP+ reductase
VFPVIERRQIVPNLHELVVEAPEVARSVRPGQFVIVRPDERGERTPLTVADWDRDRNTVTTVFLQVGASTAKLARLKAGDTIPTFAGPLGVPSPIENWGTVLCIGGCYGIASVFPIARALAAAGNEVHVLLEARSSYLLYWQERYAEFAATVLALTRDGTAGYQGHLGSVPDILIHRRLAPDRILAHGCTGMMLAASKATRRTGIPIYVSMNPIMIDGTGMCGVCRLDVAGETKFACIDGPEFPGHEIDWDAFLERRRTYEPEEVEPLHRSGSAERY